MTILKSQDYAINHESIAHQIIDINRATIYSILNRFCEDSLAHKIVAENGKQYFALCKTCEIKDHHHSHFHFQCNNCKKVEYFKSEINISLPEGYSVENFNGLRSELCSNCAAA